MSKEKTDTDLFQKKLADCDAEIIWRYNYIDDQCCEVEDEQLEVGKEIEELKVEIEILKRMGEDKNDMEIKELEDELDDLFIEKDRLWQREEILEDMWEDEFVKILKD